MLYIGQYLRCVVDEGMLVGDIIQINTEVVKNMHLGTEVPEFNAIRNAKTNAFISLTDRAIRVLEPEALYELHFFEKAATSPPPSLRPQDPPIEIVFNKNPLGITIKPVGRMYIVAAKKKSLDCYRRLVVGMEVVSCGGLPLAGMDFRDVHKMMGNLSFPMRMTFRSVTSSSCPSSNDEATAATMTTAAIKSTEKTAARETPAVTAALRKSKVRSSSSIISIVSRMYR
jgi:hypothetical protein